MPPRRPQQRPARSRGNDPTVSIATAAGAKSVLAQQPGEQKSQDVNDKANDDIERRISDWNI